MSRTTFTFTEYVNSFIVHYQSQQQDNYMTTHKHQPRSQPHKSTIGSEFGTKMNAAGVIADGQRERMIAEAAYYMAEHRHFQGGDPLASGCKHKVK